MFLKLEKIHPKFRQLTDQIFLSERTDVNLTNYKSLLRLNSKHHLEYLFAQFEKSSVIFWENSQKVWSFRLNVIFSLKEKTLTAKIQNYLEKRFINLIRVKASPDPKYDTEFSQFLEYCKIKRHRRDPLKATKEAYLEIIPFSSMQKTIKVTQFLIPYLFKDVHDFGNHVMDRILQDWRYLSLLKELRLHGFKYNQKAIHAKIKSALFEVNDLSVHFTIMSSLVDDEIRLALKSEYKPAYKENILKFVSSCDFWLLEDRWLRNIINILDVAPDLADEVAAIYVQKMYSEYYDHKKAYADKIIRLIKKCPQISSKKMLVLLANKGKMGDIKHLLKSFPELKKLSAFV
jgi:ribosomal protein L31